MKALMPSARAVLTIETSLVGAVQSMSYGRNHHWLKLRDHRGREIVLIENAVLLYICSDEKCGFRMSTEAHIGDNRPCPVCLGHTLNGVWARPQVALIPEAQSDFEMPTKHNADRRQDEADADALADDTTVVTERPLKS